MTNLMKKTETVAKSPYLFPIFVGDNARVARVMGLSHYGLARYFAYVSVARKNNFFDPTSVIYRVSEAFRHKRM